MNKKKTDPEALAKRIREAETEEYDLSDLSGVLPADRDLTQNIGCVGKSQKKKPKS
ncbi:hypothetical protein [Algoriphagus namhaensis]